MTLLKKRGTAYPQITQTSWKEAFGKNLRDLRMKLGWLR